MSALFRLDGVLTESPQRPATSDDDSLRMSAKFPRAHRHILENLGRRDLSVRQIDAHIGATARSLQAASTENMWLSPRELIQRHYMKHIRKRLLREGVPLGSPLEIASKSDGHNRRALLSSYRKEFQDAPSEKWRAGEGQSR